MQGATFHQKTLRQACHTQKRAKPAAFTHNPRRSLTNIRVLRLSHCKPSKV